jgi:hypothetical protein
MYSFASTIAHALSKFDCFESAIFFSNSVSDIEQLDPRYSARLPGRNLDYELLDADLVFTTASTSSLEILAREIPLGIGCSVPNQLEYYNSIVDGGLAAPIGERLNLGKWVLDEVLIDRLIHDQKLRQDLLCNVKDFIDLKGAARIVDAIQSL